jgi:hypothetical protein
MSDLQERSIPGSHGSPVAAVLFAEMPYGGSGKLAVRMLPGERRFGG